MSISIDILSLEAKVARTFANRFYTYGFFDNLEDRRDFLHSSGKRIQFTFDGGTNMIR